MKQAVKKATSRYSPARPASRVTVTGTMGYDGPIQRRAGATTASGSLWGFSAMTEGSRAGREGMATGYGPSRILKLALSTVS